ncbi:MAG: hypothetical protein IJL08_00065, partial [Oscillospiraceae bacterium]|nr:hypothetical protein [Oscillospiraceae bacterium]
MKHLKRALSMLLVTLMIVTTLPLSVIASAEPTETPAETAETAAEPSNVGGESTHLTGQDTDLTIDFSYAETNQIGTPEDALAQMGRDSEGNSFEVSAGFITSSANEYKWNHVTTGLTVTDNKAGSLRYFLTSEDPDHKYIVLDDNFDCDYKGSAEWKTIEITTDKVLDLNGYKLEMSYSANRRNSNDSQCSHPQHHKAVMFTIHQGATLTIIDSGPWTNKRPYYQGNYIGTEGTYHDYLGTVRQSGGIKFVAWMVDPHENDVNFFTTRDLFNVDGTLVIYGGVYQAGRQKDQLKKNFSWSKLKDVIGSAVGLGVSIAEYATGISAAQAANEDLLESFKTEDIVSGDNGGKDDVHTSTVKKDGKGGTDVTTKDTPNQKGGTNTNTGRAETVSEAKDTKNSEIADGKRQGTQEGENKANDKKTGKNDKNTKIAESEKKVVDSIINKDKIMSVVDGAFNLVDGIVGLFGSDERSRVTNMIQGTVAHVNNTGTLVVYGGTFKGYGSTPNTRNAVIEVTKQDTAHPNVPNKYNGGQVYVYGGTFEAYCGANVFNMVRSVNNMQVQQYERDVNSGDIVPKTVTLTDQETMGYRQLFFDNEAEYAAYAKYIREHPDEEETYPKVEPIPVSTKNVVIRGGTFRNYYEVMMVGLKPDTDQGDDDSNHFTKFPGSSGSVNLGIESYGEDMIRDGRIQINDRYGDGPMVLLDDRVEDDHTANDGAYHYRLFCGDTELRYKRYLEVYPNTATVNSSHSFQLRTFYGSQAQELLSKAWGSDEENIREAVFANTEEYFTFPIDSARLTPTYYVVPNLTDTDVYGEKLNASQVWYYNTPVDYDNNMILPPAYGDVLWTAQHVGNVYNPDGSLATPQHGLSYHYDSLAMFDYWTHEDCIESGSQEWYNQEFDSLAQDLQWFTYKIYRVDPLTRESISEGGYGTDIPLATVKYGASHDSLKCKLPLMDMADQIKKQAKANGIEWDGYKQGEMYRIVLEVQEYYAYDYQGDGKFINTLKPAKAVTSVCFRCVSVSEQTGGGEAGFEPDYTALQWVQTPGAGSTASVRLVNAKAGQVDLNGDKIFDIYYQWYQVDTDENGDPIENDPDALHMIAGTDNILRDPEANRQYHVPEYWDVGNDGHIYANTRPLPADKSQWTAEDIHMYTHEMCQADPRMKLRTGENLHLGNNNVFFTNTDQCYIPSNMEGKYIRVKAIVENLQWTKNFDQQQIYWSHIVKVGETNELDIKLRVTPSEGVTYASVDKPVTLSAADLRNLEENEFIKQVTYVVGSKSVTFTDLNVTDASQIPTVQYPADFFEGEPRINPGEKEAYVTIYANKTGNPPGKITHWTWSKSGSVNYAVEARGFKLASGVPASYRKSEIENGSLNGVYRPFAANPTYANLVPEYGNVTTTNRNVAYLDEQGFLYFGGAIGSADLSVTGPDGVTATKNIQVYNTIDRFEIWGLKAPKLNQTLPIPTESQLLPYGADYRIVDVYWTMDRGTDRLSASAKPQNYHAYTINVVVEPKDGYRAEGEIPFIINLTEADGTVLTRTGTTRDYLYSDYEPGGTNRHIFKHTFRAISGGSASVINKIYLDFPTEVMEGESVDEWLQQVRIYTNGDDSVLTVRESEVFADIHGVDRLRTYGANLQTAEVHTFLPGVQTGFRFYLELPTGLNVNFPTETDAVSIYVNGELKGTATAMTGKLLWAAAYDSIEVVPCTEPGVEKHVPAMPVYSLNYFELYDWVPVSVEDLLNCSEPDVTLQYAGATNADGSESPYVGYDPEENTIYGDAGQEIIDDPVTLHFNVLYDSDCDGVPEFVVEETVKKYVFNDHEDVSDNYTEEFHEDTVQTVTAYNPDGTVAYTGQYDTVYSWGRDKRTLSVPEVDGAFLLTATGGSVKGGAARINGKYDSSGSVTIETIPAADLQVYPGATQVNVNLPDS